MVGYGLGVKVAPTLIIMRGQKPILRHTKLEVMLGVP
jgi:hypothetical protein